ncbi:MAG: hypothetical protein ACQETX_07840 [Pseudomonadota bacterium]
MACADLPRLDLPGTGGSRVGSYALSGLLFLLAGLFTCSLPGHSRAAEGHVIYNNKSAESLELRFESGRWTHAPADSVPAGARVRAGVHFADGGVVVQALGYAFSNDAGSYCQVRVATVPGPVGCRIELTPINRGRMDCFARTLQRDRETCAFEVQVEVAPKRR